MFRNRILLEIKYWQHLNLVKSLSENKIAIFKKFLPIHNEYEYLKETLGREPTNQALRKLKIAAKNGIRFHRTQINSHKEELNRLKIMASKSLEMDVQNMKQRLQNSK